MYMSHFCFVLVLVSVSASYYNEELPLYLSDDILISQLPRISKRSATDQTKPGEPIHVDKDKKASVGVAEEEIENGEESGLVFIPSFGRRSRRSVSVLDQHQEKRIRRGAHDDQTFSKINNEPDVKQKKHVSEPEEASESGLVFLPSFGRRNKRSVEEKKDDLVDSESNIVFLPSFRRKGSRRFRRDVDNASKRSTDTLTKNEQKKSDSLTTERNEELSDSDTVNGQESGLVFLPSFGRRSRRSVEDKTNLHNQQKKKQDAPTSSAQNAKETQRPRGTSINNSHKTKRDVSTEKPDKTREDHSLDENTDDETEEESGLVFIPSFGRRYRRDTSSRTPTKKQETASSTPTKIEEPVPKKTFSTQESGLVFLPTFNRRTRREVTTAKPEKE